MKNSKEDIRNNAVFEFNGQLILRSIKLISNWINENINQDFQRKMLDYLSIDILQAFSRLSEYKDSIDDFSFIIGKNNYKYHIYFSKIVLSKKLLYINDELTYVYNKSAEELKKIYQETLSHGEFSEHSPYYLTLIDLKRKSRENINFRYQPYDFENSLVEVIVSFHEKLNLTRKLSNLFEGKQELVEIVFSWHEERAFRHENELVRLIDELKLNKELEHKRKVDLLTDHDYFNNLNKNF